MKNFKLILLLCLVCIFAACGMKEAAATDSDENMRAANSTSSAPSKSAEPKISEARPFSVGSTAPDTSEPVTFPFPDFPKVETSAKAGDFILVPSYSWLQDAADKGAESTNFIWYAQKMAAPGKEYSEVQFMSERRKVPNAYIVAIAPGQKAKTGDVVLTWWQTGSGMQRAIVVDDKNSAMPIVRYLDIDYDNPAKSADNVTTIGKMDERIQPDTFIKLKEWDAGTIVAIQDGANTKKARVIRVAGDKVLTTDQMGKLKIYPKASCKALPIIPQVKEGDRVKAPKYGQNFENASVTKVDSRIGRIFVKFDGQNEEKAISFGDIMK